MLKPEAMQRTLIVSSKGHQARVIETLHDLRAFHFVEFTGERGDPALAEFRIGSPLPEGPKASENLVRIRALLRQVGIEGKEPTRALSVADLESRLDAQLTEAERQVTTAIETRESARNQVQEGRELESRLEPLRALPLRLEDYRGYDTLSVMVGRVDTRRLDAELDTLRQQDHLLVQGDGGIVALFVPRAHAAAFQEALYRAGFQEMEVPAGKGSPDERIREIQSQRSSLESRARQADQEVQRLATQHGDFLLAADEHLGIIVEKAEAPLAFASTDNAFVVDAWVPASDIANVEKALEAATDGNVYFQLIENGSAHAHKEGAHVDALFDAEEHVHTHAEDDRDSPPTKYANPRAARPFEYFTGLFSTPRYNEADPTLLFAIFFPIFFGFMIGDVGTGLLMLLMGALLVRKLGKIDGMRQLGIAITIAGVVAIIFGLVFMKFMGIPIGVTHEMEHHLEDYGVDPHAAGFDWCTYTTYKTLHEPTLMCLLGVGEVHLEPLVYKVTDLSTMLLLSVGAAFVHLLIALFIGIRNEIGHGVKHLTAKFGYLLLLVTFLPAVVALLRPDMFAGYTGEALTTAITLDLPFTTTQAYMLAGVGFVLGAVVLGWAEGVGGVLEIPTMFSNIMSYLRLAAVCIAKGAMALAFNDLILIQIGQVGSGWTATAVLWLVIGLVVWVIVHTVLFVLGLLSGGIQALRLNFVEFFTKFYKGGGKPFRPFGRERRSTVLDKRVTAGSAGATPVLLKP